MIAIIIIVGIGVVVVLYVVHRLVAARRNKWVKIIDAEGEHHRIPMPPRSVPGENIRKTNVFFTTATIAEIQSYIHRSLQDAGWTFGDISGVPPKCYSIVLHRDNKRLHLLMESDITILQGSFGTKLTFAIAVNVKRSPLEEELAEIKSLGKVGNKDAVEPLLALLDDPRERIRREAVAALTIIKDERSLQQLINKIKDDDTGVRQHAAIALGELGSNQAVEPLIAGLNTKDHGFNACCAYSLGKIKDKRAVKALIFALEHPYLKLVEHAAIALGEIGDRSAIEPLIACMKDTNNDATMRAMAYLSLRKLLNPAELSAMIESLTIQSGQSSFEDRLKDEVAKNVAEFGTEIIFDLLGIDH